MTKSSIVLVAVLALLGVIYAIYFTDWFEKDTIQIIATIRPPASARQARTAPRARDEAPVYPVTFAFDNKYKLTKVSVLAADDVRTNKYPTPLWELISDTESVPTKILHYGVAPRGMKPSVPRARPQPLQPDVVYLLRLEAGKIRAETNFHTRELVVPQNP
jgi:hypothetical protein